MLYEDITLVNRCTLNYENGRNYVNLTWRPGPEGGRGYDFEPPADD